MNKKTISSSIVFWLLIISIATNSCSEFGTIKTVVIENKSLGETIYLKWFARGLNYERSVITSDPDLDTEKKIDEQAYQENFGSPYFYKLSNDTLSIYGGNWVITENSNFRTTVVFNELTNPEFIKLTKDYEKKGLKVFPPSHKKFFND
jgi:hypothetical protein